MKLQPIAPFTLARLALFFACGAAFGQTASREFEVASIKPSPPPDDRGYTVFCRGGPETDDPGLFVCENMSLSALVTLAYRVAYYQLSAPDWMMTARFHLTARIPEGSTKEQAAAMLRNLLAARFKLTVHHESREISKYDLVVAKTGPKFKDAAQGPAPEETAAGDNPRIATPTRLTLDRDGYPALAPGRPGMAWMNDRARLYDPSITMDMLAGQISGQMGKPVTNATGLTGKYEISFYWAADIPQRSSAPPLPGAGPAPAASTPERDAGPTLMRALEDQLGLRLEAKKGPVDFIVVDRSEKLPTEIDSQNCAKLDLVPTVNASALRRIVLVPLLIPIARG